MEVNTITNTNEEGDKSILSIPSSVDTNDDIKVIEAKLEQINLTRNDIPLLITNPELKQGGIKTDIIYSIYGKNNTKPILRQYSDFCALREKLNDQWPGIYIPNLLPDNLISNFDNRTIDSRMRILNRFCSQLSNIPFIYKSKEVQYFLSDSEDISDQLDNSPPIEFKELIERYKVAISLNVDIALYDLKKANEDLKYFKTFISDSLRNIKKFKEYVRQTMNNKTKEIHNYICLLNVFKDYEHHALTEYADNDDTKLVFNNGNNKELKEKYDKVIKGLQNPYNSLSEWLEEDEIDFLGMLEAIESIEHLQSEYDRLCLKDKDIDQRIIDEAKGKPKSLFSSLLNFKSSEEILLELKEEKENTQIGIYYLDVIIKKVFNYMISIFEDFKIERLSDYHKHLRKFNDIQIANNAYIIDIWKCVQKDHNIQPSPKIEKKEPEVMEETTEKDTIINKEEKIEEVPENTTQA